ncbi:hypothetical protein, partial [Bilophila wadsworthia]|uniref:hypothetical protein n=1 Tax=Bilophila wadsworthia TaxID=35833 RepID=UPI00266D958B
AFPEVHRERLFFMAQYSGSGYPNAELPHKRDSISTKVFEEGEGRFGGGREKLSGGRFSLAPPIFTTPFFSSSRACR